jgi:hypothetical protein
VCVPCHSYHEDESDEQRLPKWLDCRLTRRIYDAALVAAAPGLIADFIGVDILGAHHILMTCELVEESKAKCGPTLCFLSAWIGLS